MGKKAEKGATESVEKGGKSGQEIKRHRKQHIFKILYSKCRILLKVGLVKMSLRTG